jgi:Protein phosphatase 2C
MILDGATAPASTALCQHGARWFSRTLGTRLFLELSAEPPVWIAEGVARAIDAVLTIHSETCEIDDQTHPSATIAVVRQLSDVYEYYVLGDSTIIFDMSRGQLAVRSDKRLRQVAISEREHVMATHIEGRERTSALVDLVNAERAHRNVRRGYWIASANPDAAAHGLQGHVRDGDVHRVALLSDGAASIVERYNLMDWRSALDLMEKGGPQEIIRAVRKTEDSDPKAERWPRSKPHDDATAVFCMPE